MVVKSRSPFRGRQWTMLAFHVRSGSQSCWDKLFHHFWHHECPTTNILISPGYSDMPFRAFFYEIYYCPQDWRQNGSFHDAAFPAVHCPGESMGGFGCVVHMLPLVVVLIAPQVNPRSPHKAVDPKCTHSHRCIQSLTRNESKLEASKLQATVGRVESSEQSELDRWRRGPWRVRVGDAGLL